MFYFFLIGIALASKSARRTYAQTQITQEELQNANYLANINQSLIFQYTNYPGAYNISLIEQEFQKANIINSSKTLEPIISQGCIPYERQLIHKQLQIIQLFNTNEDSFDQSLIYTSLFASTYSIFITRSDLTLTIIQIEYDLENQRITPLSYNQIFPLKETLKVNVSNDENIQLQCAQYFQDAVVIKCYILTEYGTLYFEYDQIKKNMIQMKKLEIERKSKIIHTFLDIMRNFILITYSDCVEIYKIDQQQIYLQKVIQPYQGANLVQSSIDQRGQKLFILDQYSGIYIYEINSQVNITESKIYIYLKNGQSFDYYDSIFFVLAQTEDEMPYVIEIFVDLEDYWYYFNQIYEFDQEIYDVFVGSQFALFVGTETHKMIFHSLYNKFHNDIETFSFLDIDLIQIDQILPPFDSDISNLNAIESGFFQQSQLFYHSTYFAGISETQISIFQIKSIPPWVLCSAIEPKKQFYTLQFDSQNCENKENAQNPYEKCQVTANFTFEGQHVLLFEEDSKLILILSFVFGILIIGLLIATILCKKHYYQKLNDLNEQSLDQVKQIQHMEQMDTVNLRTYM